MGYQGNPSNNSVVVHPTELRRVSNGRCITRGWWWPGHIIPSGPELKVHLPKEYGCTLHHVVALGNSSTWSTIWSGSMQVLFLNSTNEITPSTYTSSIRGVFFSA
jgi:hypothetical protein